MSDPTVPPQPERDAPPAPGGAATATAPAPADGSAPADPLARLYHMSTTAGVGTQDYVAINPTSIAALLLGFAGVLSLLSSILLIIPAVGAVCAIIALVQIHRSNGTQAGRAFAAGGLLLALLFGGGRAAYDAVIAMRTTADELQVEQVMRQFGQELAAGNYQAAYQRFDDRFRERVSLPQFRAPFETLKENQAVGPLTSIEWNHQRMQLEEGPDGRAMVVGMALFHYQNRPNDPSRIYMDFAKTADQQWRITDMPSFFPTKKPR